MRMYQARVLGVGMRSVAERRDYRALERRHGGAARALDEAVAKYAAETEARQSAESLAEVGKLAMETEERLRLDTAGTLSEERQQRPHAETDTRAALPALAAEEGRRRAEVTRVARLPEEMDRHVPFPSLPAAALSAAAAHPTFLYPMRRFFLVF